MAETDDQRNLRRAISGWLTGQINDASQGHDLNRTIRNVVLEALARGSRLISGNCRSPSRS